MPIHLIVHPALGETFASQHDGLLVRIGRSGRSDVRLPGTCLTVSWDHARIELRPDGAFLSDERSRNGTFVNGRRVTAELQLQEGDRLTLGEAGPELQVEAIELPSAPPQPPARPSPGLHDRPAVAAGTPGAGRRYLTRRRIVSALAGTAVVTSAAILYLSLPSLSPRKAKNDDASSTPPVAHTPAVEQGKRPQKVAVDPQAEAAPQIAEQGVAQAAETVLRKYCHRCHGEQGSNEGGFNFVLNRDRLVADEYVAPGNPDGSYLLKRMLEREMPPEGEEPLPREVEIAQVRQWISAGAPPVSSQPSHSFIPVEDVAQAVADDLRHTEERSRRYARYFLVTHLVNAGAGGDELETYRHAVSKLVNSLSWKRQITRPRAIGPAGAVLRIDLRDYDWSEATWDEIVSFNPYSVVYASPAAQECYRLTQTEVPWVHGDWFVFKASRPPLYERILRIPASAAELEAMLLVNVGQNIDQETVRRAGFNSSGVSQNNRLIERHDSPHGAYWKSYDFASNTGRQNLFEHPLGPAGDGLAGRRQNAFVHDGGELIFNLPNGLQGYLLVDGQGKRIERGPVQIVSDPKQADRTVINGISCMSCHYAGIIRKDDEIRDPVLENRPAFPEADDILSLYPPREEMRALMDQDAERFRQAVEATGSSISENGEPVVNMAARFRRDLDLRQSAAETGLEPGPFLAGIELAPGIQRVLGPLKVSGGTVKRDVFIDTYGALVQTLGLGRYIPRQAN